MSVLHLLRKWVLSMMGYLVISRARESHLFTAIQAKNHLELYFRLDIIHHVHLPFASGEKSTNTIPPASPPYPNTLQQPLLQNLNQLIQSLNNQVRMFMIHQMPIHIINQQHRLGPRPSSSRHVINTIPHHDQSARIRH